MNRMRFVAVGLGISTILVSPVWAQSSGGAGDTGALETVGSVGDAQFFAGVRVWANAWDIPHIERRGVIDPANPFSLVWRDQVEASLSDMEIVPMPTIGVRYGRLVGSVTYFVPTSYEGDDIGRSVDRSEIDFNLGYHVLPSLVVSVGYKAAKADLVSDFGPTNEQKIKGLLLGISGNAPLSDRVAMYANAAYGIARQKADVRDARGDDRYSARYVIGELGLSYRLLERQPASFVKAVTASVGYRIQTYTTKDVGIGTYASADGNVPLSTATRDARTTTNGLVLAIVGSF